MAERQRWFEGALILQLAFVAVGGILIAGVAVETLMATPVQSVFWRAARRLVATHTRIIRGAAATVGKRRIALNRYPDAPFMDIE